MAGPVPIEERFWPKVSRASVEECWDWQACRDPRGYGRIRMDGVPALAHRVAYELLVGKVPAGLELDHLCRNPACVNPAHLEPVTHQENSRRSDSPSGRNSRKTHCPKGHALIEENIYRRPSRPHQRECRECIRDRWRADLGMEAAA